jgi:hypothetical protein
MATDARSTPTLQKPADGRSSPSGTEDGYALVDIAGPALQ